MEQQHIPLPPVIPAERLDVSIDGLAQMFREMREQDEKWEPAPPDPLFRMVVFEAVEWALLAVAAAALDELSAAAANTRPWNSKFNLVGIVGEAVYARVAGLPFDPIGKVDRLRSRGLSDGGEDFPGVDVKAVTRSPPLLMRLRSDPLKAPAYALVFVDLAARCGRYVGYATRKMLDKAPDQEFGYGPTRTLAAERLIRELVRPSGARPTLPLPTKEEGDE